MARVPPCVSYMFVTQKSGRVQILVLTPTLKKRNGQGTALCFIHLFGSEIRQSTYNPDRRHRPQGLYKTSPLYFHPASAAPWTLAKKSCMTVNTRLSVTRFGKILWTPTLKKKTGSRPVFHIWGCLRHEAEYIEPASAAQAHGASTKDPPCPLIVAGCISFCESSSKKTLQR